MQTDKSAVEKAIENAKETCEQGNVGACAAAWDEVCPMLPCLYQHTSSAASPTEEDVCACRWRS